MIKVYGKSGCPECTKARAFFQSTGIPYQYFELYSDYQPSELKALIPGARSLPQIFDDDGTLIGDYNDLVEFCMEEIA